MAEIIILPMRTAYSDPNVHVINACSNSVVDWQSDLSPFKIGPCELYDGNVALNMENAYQYAKVYKQHLEGWAHKSPSMAYWKWATEGWANPRAVRYPMGRGAKPEFSLWKGERLGYVDARKQIYGPLFAKAVVETSGYKQLKAMYDSGMALAIRDFDGYDHDKLEMTLTDVLNNPKKKMGHAFVLKMLLTNDVALKQFGI